MPEFLQNLPHLPPVAAATVSMIGIAIAITRLLTASKAFWWAFPEWLQKGLPAALVAVGTLPAALERAQSWLDVGQALLMAAGAWFTASRGDKRPVELPPGKGGDDSAGLTDDPPAPAPPPSIRPRAGVDAPISSLAARIRLSLLVYAGALACFCLLVGVAMACAGCDLRKPPCDESRLRAIDAHYSTAVLDQCLAKYDNKEACPAFAGLQAEHRRKLAEACPQ
jgi:hypothetical protein